MKAPKSRYLSKYILKDLDKKIVLLGGPRQVGKTTLAKALVSGSYYLNYDVVSDRKIIREQTWPKDSELLVLDELHKLPKWKSYLKGICDDQEKNPRIIVTGSAKLDTVKKVGDSLAGRYLYWKLHPLCLKELKELKASSSGEKNLEKILNQSGFPEPFYESEDFYPRWAKSHLDIILRQDLLDLEQVSDILSIETLIELLSERVGQVVSYESLAEDLNKSPNTIKKWITHLENLFIIFRVTTFSKNIGRSLLKSPKFYFFDTARVQGNAEADIGAKFENFVACSLLKEIDYVNDLYGSSLRLQYLRNRQGHEIDFAVTDKDKIHLLLEAKWADENFSSGFKAFNKAKEAHKASAVQLVAKAKKVKENALGVRIEPAVAFLESLDFSKYGVRNKVRL
jgi:predicted AAA+ superfamily ATPase